MRASFANNSQKKKNYFFVRKDLFLWELLWRFLKFSYDTENPIGTTRWQQWLTWIYHIVLTEPFFSSFFFQQTVINLKLFLTTLIHNNIASIKARAFVLPYL